MLVHWRSPVETSLSIDTLYETLNTLSKMCTHPSANIPTFTQNQKTANVGKKTSLVLSIGARRGRQLDERIIQNYPLAETITIDCDVCVFEGIAT